MTSAYARALRQAAAALLGALYPGGCSLCEQVLGVAASVGVCEQCWSHVRPFDCCVCPGCGRPEEGAAEPEKCLRCLTQDEPFDSARSWAPFEGEVAGVLRRIKFAQTDRLVSPLADRIAESQETSAWLREATLLAPVPLHWRRRVQRGFDQAEAIARELSRRLGIPSQNILRRTSATRPQVGLGAAARRRNLANAFCLHVPSRYLQGKTVCLVDDVWTTGTTIREAARSLREAGPTEVRAFTVARA